MLISPRIPVGVDSTLYDHSSVLNFIEENWQLNYLTERDKNANNFNHLILSEPRDDIPLIEKNLDIISIH